MRAPHAHGGHAFSRATYCTHALMAPPFDEEKNGTRHNFFSLHHHCHAATPSSTRDDCSAWREAGGLFTRGLLHVRVWGHLNVLVEIRAKKSRSMNRRWQMMQSEANEWRERNPLLLCRTADIDGAGPEDSGGRPMSTSTHGGPGAPPVAGFCLGVHASVAACGFPHQHIRAVHGALHAGHLVPLRTSAGSASVHTQCCILCEPSPPPPPPVSHPSFQRCH